MRSGTPGGATGEWKNLDRPTITRMKTNEKDATKAASVTGDDEESRQYLDIPAFLRRQETDA